MSVAENATSDLLLIGAGLLAVYLVAKGAINLSNPLSDTGADIGGAVYDATHLPDNWLAPANSTEAQIRIVINYSDFDAQTVNLAIQNLQAKGYTVYSPNSWFVRVVAP